MNIYDIKKQINLYVTYEVYHIESCPEIESIVFFE